MALRYPLRGANGTPGFPARARRRILRPVLSSLFLLVAAPFVGSFLGVVVERLPAGESVVHGRSRCRACGAALGPRDLVPFLSWLFLRGRCRHCGADFGWFHPAIELAALVVALWALAVLPGWLAWPTAVLGWALVAMAEIDRRHMILPDALTLPLIPLGLAVAWVLPGAAFADHLIGAIVGALVLGLVALAYERVRGREGLGYGDVKLYAAAGAWLGWQGLPSVLLIGAVTGLAAALVLRARADTAVPFGPFLAFGFWLTWLYGPIG